MTTLASRADHDLRSQPTPMPAGAYLAPLVIVLSTYRDGDEHGWLTEFTYLQRHHADRIQELASTIRRDGIREPILLGSDGRVWDGHHRLCVAYLLGLYQVPVIRATH